MKKKPSRWIVALKYAMGFLMVVFVFLGTSYAYSSRLRSVRTSCLIQCRQATKSEKWADLQQLAERWTAWDKRNGDAWVFRADAAEHLGDLPLAAECLEAIPLSDAKSLPALVSLSSLQFNALNRPFDGVKTCERMLNLEPRTTAAHQQLIEFYAMTLQRRLLEHQIRFAIRSNREPPASYVYLFLIDTMRLEAGVEANTRWFEHYPDSEIFQVARVLQMAEPSELAQFDATTEKHSLVKSLLEKYPRNVELLAYQTDLRIRKGEIDELMELLMDLPAEVDGDSRFWRAKGWLHLTRGELVKSKEALNKAIELYPLDWYARNWLADALRSEGNLAEADRLHSIVRQSRELRQQITASTGAENFSNDVLTQIAGIADQCGDIEVAQALKRRLRLP